MSKVILAFSGGLDTTFCVPYFQEQGLEVITATVNTGGFSKEELQEISQKSKNLGAIEHFEIDAQQELYNDFISYIIKANFLKGGTYPSCVGTERVITAIKIADLAKKKGVTKIAHGSTAAGNDQVRFDSALQTLLPGCEIINPIRDDGWKRAEEVDYLQKKGIEIDQSTKDYSINVGLLGTSIGGKETKSTAENIPDNIFPSVVPIDQTPDDRKEITITFEQGLPVALDGNKKSGVEIIQELNELCAQYGYGKDYHIGTTIIGLKGRLAFEAPALKALIKVHTELEKITLTSKQSNWKNIIGQQYGNYIHEALYFEPVMRDFEKFLNSANKYVSGDVTIELYKGHLTVTKMESPYSLLNSKIGEYGEEAKGWSGLEAKGFCKLYGFESKSAFLTQNLI